MKNEKNIEFKKRLYKLVLITIKLVENAEKSSTTKIIGNQLIRSITSILANYIEGYAASLRKDYINFFNFSLKSENESKVWVCLLRDTNTINIDEANLVLKELDEVSKIFASSILTMRGKRAKH